MFFCVYSSSSHTVRPLRLSNDSIRLEFGGIVRPICLAAFTLIINSSLIGLFDHKFTESLS